jgi:DNA-directed RNA polymerase subunit F
MSGLPPIPPDQQLALSHLRSQTIATAQNAAAARAGHPVVPLTLNGGLPEGVADALLRARDELTSIYATYGKTPVADHLVALIDAALKQLGVSI